MDDDDDDYYYYYYYYVDVFLLIMIRRGLQISEVSHVIVKITDSRGRRFWQTAHDKLCLFPVARKKKDLENRKLLCCVMCVSSG